MVNAHEGPEIPENRLEGHENAEKSDYFIRFTSSGGSLSEADFNKVVNFVGISFAQGTGISHPEREDLWRERIIPALGSKDTRAEDSLWLHSEADAFIAAFSSEPVSAAVTSAVSKVTSETHDKVVVEKPEGFDKYKQHKGSLDEVAYAKVIDSIFTDDVYSEAMNQLINSNIGMPDHSMVEMAAKLKTALAGDTRLQKPMWFLPELYLLLKRY